MGTFGNIGKKLRATAPMKAAEATAQHVHDKGTSAVKKAGGGLFSALASLPTLGGAIKAAFQGESKEAVASTLSTVAQQRNLRP